MSEEDYLRRQVQDQMRQGNDLQKVESHQVKDYWTQQVINSEIERQRQAEEERRRRGS
jgi:hypothetical protein